MSNPLEIITDEGDYNQLVRDLRCPRVYSKHVVRECAVCGLTEWSSSTQGDKIIEIWPMETGCPRCATVASRSPEVYSWAIGIMIQAERNVERKRRLSAPVPSAQ